VIHTCLECGGEFLADESWQDLCLRCADVERSDLQADANDYYPLSRTERLRERLGVSGNVDE
jgi:hypothetical protein